MTLFELIEAPLFPISWDVRFPVAHLSHLNEAQFSIYLHKDHSLAYKTNNHQDDEAWLRNDCRDSVPRPLPTWIFESIRSVLTVRDDHYRVSN